MRRRDEKPGPVPGLRRHADGKGHPQAIAAPRGHAKSTVMSLQNVLHAALFGYILLVSDTGSGGQLLDAIKTSWRPTSI
ncbi:MAG: hypothetical protein ACLUPV_05220 [Bilophila wadsworthia]